MNHECPLEWVCQERKEKEIEFWCLSIQRHQSVNVSMFMTDWLHSLHICCQSWCWVSESRMQCHSKEEGGRRATLHGKETKKYYQDYSIILVIALEYISWSSFFTLTSVFVVLSVLFSSWWQFRKNQFWRTSVMIIINWNVMSVVFDWFKDKKEAAFRYSRQVKGDENVFCSLRRRRRFNLFVLFFKKQRVLSKDFMKIWMLFLDVCCVSENFDLFMCIHRNSSSWSKENTLQEAHWSAEKRMFSLFTSDSCLYLMFTLHTWYIVRDVSVS